MKITIAALSLALIATGATAQQFVGAEIGANYSYQPSSPSSEFYSLDGSAELGFGKISVQLDASAFKWGASNNTESSAIVHGIYTISDTLAIGLFAGVEDWNQSEGQNYVVTGLEGKYTLPSLPLEFEVFWYSATAVVSNDVYDVVSIEATYGVTEKIDVFVGYEVMYNSSVYDASFANIGASYNLNNGISISGEYIAANGAFGFSSEGLNFRVSKSFGGGVSFGQRDWSYITRGQ